MYVAQLRDVPVGNGSSMEKPLEKVVAALEATGISFQVGPIGTLLEAEDLDAILQAVRAAHDAAAQEAPRVLLDLSVDHRLDKEEDVESLAALTVEPAPA